MVVSRHTVLMWVAWLQCETQLGMELARVSLVNEEREVLLDMLVQPSKPITNYLTKWSGITAATLEGVTATLADAQAKIRSLLPANAILAGHSLENDLHALQVCSAGEADGMRHNHCKLACSDGARPGD